LPARPVSTPRRIERRHIWAVASIAALLGGFVLVVSGSPHAKGRVPFTTTTSCQAPTPGRAQPASITVLGGRPPYVIDWTLNGHPDLTDLVTQTPASYSGRYGSTFTIHVVPGSSTATLRVRVIDSGQPRNGAEATLIGPPGVCYPP
jgi:hypothetical protein